MTLTPIETTKKAIIYRSRHRGTKEADFLISTFVNNVLEGLCDQDVNVMKDWIDMDDESFFAQVKNPQEPYTKLATQFAGYQASL